LTFRTLGMTEVPRGIVVFDLDGTLLRGETVCEVLARPLGRIDRMREFEQYRSEAEIADARKQMTEWYEGHTLEALCAHLRNATWAPGARRAVRDLQKANIVVAIASITWQFAVEWFANQLSVCHRLGTELGSGGKITHVWGRDKARWLEELAGSYGIPRRRIAAVGDSSGDAEMLRAAHLRFYVGAMPRPDIPSLVHIPNADLRVIADRIIATWANRAVEARGAVS
jgi:HAD superfamily phosphoserine phosphatase-like hydrolase